MPDSMFRDVVDPSITVGGKKRYTVPSSIAVHALLLALVLVLPILAPDILPNPPAMLAFVAIQGPPLAPPPPAPARADESRPPAHDIDLTAAPIQAPPDIAPEPDLHSSSGGASGDDRGSVVNGISESLSSLPATAAPPPPPPSVAPQTATGPMRLHTGINPPIKVTDVKPTYPPIALAARVQGTVILEVTIGTTGHVEALKVLGSIALLDQAAVDAVRQWEYSPALLNGAPVPIIMTVTVRFAMN